MEVFLSQNKATSTRIHWFSCLVYHNSSKGSVTTRGVLNKNLYGEAPTLVSFAAVIRVFTQRSSPASGKEHCVTTLVTAAKETAPTLEVQHLPFIFDRKGTLLYTFIEK